MGQHSLVLALGILVPDFSGLSSGSPNLLTQFLLGVFSCPSAICSHVQSRYKPCIKSKELLFIKEESHSLLE